MVAQVNVFPWSEDEEEGSSRAEFTPGTGKGGLRVRGVVGGLGQDKAVTASQRENGLTDTGAAAGFGAVTDIDVRSVKSYYFAVSSIAILSNGGTRPLCTASFIQYHIEVPVFSQVFSDEVVTIMKFGNEPNARVLTGLMEFV
ncbi:hypothetical protein NDU88_004579 [Pleurodeles waltl]|uniref:Uncharacterized protein n=1 Tax=Pleurodeles waltl TaxID=8319 RepID=A0AAV7RIN9_PLEWA|nr:hypothetical protein NDU88_004579 [Pleurodeles waltl]